MSPRCSRTSRCRPGTASDRDQRRRSRHPVRRYVRSARVWRSHRSAIERSEHSRRSCPAKHPRRIPSIWSLPPTAMITAARSSRSPAIPRDRRRDRPVHPPVRVGGSGRRARDRRGGHRGRRRSSDPHYLHDGSWLARATARLRGRFLPTRSRSRPPSRSPGQAPTARGGGRIGASSRRSSDLRVDEAAGIIATALERGSGWLDPTEVERLLSCYGDPERGVLVRRDAQGRGGCSASDRRSGRPQSGRARSRAQD